MKAEDRDHLTQLLTRAEFDSALRNALSLATADQPAGLIMIDLDYFKRINDKHGHPAGDSVLSDMGRLLSRVAKGKGLAFRYGGEEFSVVLPNHGPEEALSVAERIRRSVADESLGGLAVTCSCGVAIATSHASTAEEWLKRADEALYDAKQRGRDLVRLYGEPPPESTRSRQPKRKTAQPGTISDEEKEELRRAILRIGGAECPIDDIPLDVRDVTVLGESGRSFKVHCPGCGFRSTLPGPDRG